MGIFPPNLLPLQPPPTTSSISERFCHRILGTAGLCYLFVLINHPKSSSFFLCCVLVWLSVNLSITAMIDEWRWWWWWVRLGGDRDRWWSGHKTTQNLRESTGQFNANITEQLDAAQYIPFYLFSSVSISKIIVIIAIQLLNTIKLLG